MADDTDDLDGFAAHIGDMAHDRPARTGTGIALIPATAADVAAWERKAAALASQFHAVIAADMAEEAADHDTTTTVSPTTIRRA